MNHHSVHKMNEISESYPYESESMGGYRNRRSQDIYEEAIKREDNDIDFELDLWYFKGLVMKSISKESLKK